MQIINNQLLISIESIVRDIEREYQRTQGLILTEDDLKCIIFCKLASLFQNRPRLFSHLRLENQANHLPIWRSATMDAGTFATPVHAEIPWYDENNKLTIRPDITILEPNNLSISHSLSGLALPSKQVEFGGQGIIFEIKFNRFKNGISRHFFSRINDDFNKIQGLFRKLRNQGKDGDLYCFFIVFNKTDLKCEEFQNFLDINREGLNHTFLYGTGLVNSPSSGRTR